MDKPIFVAREPELARLEAILERSLAGVGQICFVTGEAGSGKTALIRAFTQKVQQQHHDLIVAIGQCDAQTGIGDAYLPFREILGQLTGDVDAELERGAISSENAGRLRKLLNLSGQALVELGPDLIEIFVPGAGLAMRVGSFLAERAGWIEKLEKMAKRPDSHDGSGRGIEQTHIFEQYTNVLKALADKHPLILVLDDLHWADKASTSLLFRLGRRIENSRILLLGAYRPDEVSLGRDGDRHPLEKVLAEFGRYYGDVQIDLGKAREIGGREFVDAIIDSQPNLLNASFRAALYHHTGGHPLFTIELLRDMQERGDLVSGVGGRWVEGADLNWAILPARVEGVIKERIGRLETELRDVLTVASVEGEDFTAEVIARIRSLDVGGLVNKLSGTLEKQHRLVSGRGVLRLESGRLSLYQFQHNLFQTYLYGELDSAERARLHEDVGQVLETLYDERVDDIAVQLAHHFVNADMPEKARRYLSRAGHLAAARHANEEALDYFRRALEMTSENSCDQRYDLQVACLKIKDLQGERMAQARLLADLEGLARTLDDDLRRAEVALLGAAYLAAMSRYEDSIDACKEAIRFARLASDDKIQARAFRQWGQALTNLGQYDLAKDCLQQALKLAGIANLNQTKAACLLNLGNLRLYQGDYDRARHFYKDTLRLCQRIDARRVALRALNNLAILSGEQGNFADAESYYQRTMQGAREMGDRMAESMALNNLGVHYEEQGNFSAAVEYYRKALAIKREIGERSGEAITRINIARLLSKQGDYETSLTDLNQSLEMSRQIQNRDVEMEALTFLGLLHHNSGNHEAAYRHSRLALGLALEIGNRNAQAYLHTYLGHALAGLKRFGPAEEAYQQAFDLRKEFGQPQMAMEPLAGLGLVALAQNDLVLALRRVNQILEFLDGGSLDGCEEPLRVYLACYRVLEAAGDPRADLILEKAHAQMLDQASRISSAALRRTFLEGVPIHREILEAWGKKNQSNTLSIERR